MTGEPHALLVAAFFCFSHNHSFSEHKVTHNIHSKRKRRAMMYLDITTVMALYTGLGNFLHFHPGPIRSSWIIWVMLDSSLFKHKDNWPL